MRERREMTEADVAQLILSYQLADEAKRRAKRESVELADALGWDWAWLDEHCPGDGSVRLAGGGASAGARPVAIAGEIRDGQRVGSLRVTGRLGE